MLMLDDRTKALIRALLYPVQFEVSPEQGIERVMKLVVARNALQATASDYLRAIDSALDSDERLSTLIPQSHDEDTIRSYLRRLIKELQTRGVAAALR
jgi:hypothetical protein